MGRLSRSFAAGCLFLAAAGSAQAQQTCSLAQITNSSGTPSGPQISNHLPAIDAAGNRVAFGSNADFVGQNGDGSFEIFLWDAATGFTQITQINEINLLEPAINATGNRIAFSSIFDLVGSNGDGNREIFLWDAVTGFTQVTSSSSGDNQLPRLNADGTRITFSSTADLVGSNGDHNYEIFLWDASTGLTQVTNTTGGDSVSPQISAAGNRIAFSSDADSLGSNIDHNPEIFLWDVSAGLTRITDTDSYANRAALNAAGDRIAFLSNGNFTGSNGDFSDEVFLWNAATGLTQITAFPPLTSLNFPSINAAGNRVAFFDSSSPGGPGGILLWDAATGVFRILSGNGLFPSINAAGNRIAFYSNANPLGSNGDGNYEIFLATCPGGAPVEAAIPAVSPLGLATLAALLGLAAAWILRRREPVQAEP